MKTKRKSLAQVCHEEAVGEGWWDGSPDLVKAAWRKSAARIRREVIRRELEKAEDALGVRRLHGDGLHRSKAMLESRHAEKAASAIILGRDNT